MTHPAPAPVADAPVARSVAVSASTQLVARGFDLLVNVIVSLAIVRYLGAAQYGDFVLIVSVVGLAGLLSEFGLPKLAVKEVAREGHKAGAVIGTVTVVRVGLCLVSALVAQLALFALGASATVRIAALVASSQFLAEALLSVVVVFHVALRQQHEAAVRLAANVVKLILVLVLIASGANLVALVAATTATLFIAAGLAWLLAIVRFDLRPSWDRARVRPMMRAALPVGPAMLIGVLYLKLDALMVALLGTRQDTGVYGAAYQPIEYLFLASAVVVQVLFPLLARAHGRDRAAFHRVYQRGSEMLVATVLPVGLVLAISARPLTGIAYHDEFQAAAVPMALLALALVLMACNVWQGLVLLAADRQHANLRYLTAAVVLNVVLDLFLIPWLGPAGAAWGTLLSATFLVVCSTAAASHLADAKLTAPGIVRVIGANLALLVVVMAARAFGVNWAVAAVIGLMSYPVWLALLRVVGAADLRAVLHRAPGHEPGLVGSIS